MEAEKHLHEDFEVGQPEGRRTATVRFGYRWGTAQLLVSHRNLQSFQDCTLQRHWMRHCSPGYEIVTS
jgi:hypothetical protein